MIDHSERKHALLSASGATRWINCPPSARMEDSLEVGDTSSVYAEEGTLAHEFADVNLWLSSHVGAEVSAAKAAWKAELEKLRAHELYSPEMEEYVEVYTDYVLGQWVAAKKVTPDAELRIEERTDFSYLVPEGFGTSDAGIIADNTLEMVDLKYGKGVKVVAKDNAQLRLYALGLLRKYQLLYDIHTVKMTIVQPRLDHIDSEVLSVGDLITWADEVLQPAAQQAYEGAGECNPGEWCRWCKAKPVCRALADHNLQLAGQDFADPKTLSDAEVLEAYEQSSLLVDWANSVAAYLHQTALDGKAWPGYKLVEGRSNRAWASETRALDVLTGKGFELDDITNTKIKGIGDIEKKVGKVEFEALNLTIKPPGKPTFVPDSDKRPGLGLQQAKKDFQ